MKRFIAVFLIVSLIISFSGCANKRDKFSDTVTFYYICSEYEYNSDENVIVAEQRELSGSRDDLSYLLTLYLLGPLTENLESPFPSRARILDIKEADTGISITLSGMDALLSDAKFPLGASCLAMTVFGLKECYSVSVYSGERSITLTDDNIILTDQISQSEDVTEETQ